MSRILTLFLISLIVSSHAFVGPSQRGLLPKSSSLSSSKDDDEYPQNFTGRLWFSPSLVKVPSSNNQIAKDQLDNRNVSILSLFGYTVGGVVALEYDSSPVGPYREYVTMSALVQKGGAFGQWGSRLYVSEPQAETICQDLWGIPAELAQIDFQEEGVSSSQEQEGDGGPLQVTMPPSSNNKEEKTSTSNKSNSIDFLSQLFGSANKATKQQKIPSIELQGWKNTRVLTENDSQRRWGGIPVYWTPTIKALWTPPLFVTGGGDNKQQQLPLYKLRLSASALRLHWSGFQRKAPEGFGIPIGLIVDNVLIEIGTRRPQNL